MITTILWDLDGTLLNFYASERVAIRKLFDEFGFGACTDEMLLRYSEINIGYWRQIEANRMDKQTALVARFRDFLNEYGKDASVAEDFNERYQLALGDTVCYIDESFELVKSLRGSVKQYIVTNGTLVAQTKKLKSSGFDQLMDGCFLSDELGVEKPSPRFFEKVFAAIEEKDKENIMIVGDTLSSDMRGGDQAGIKTCWYNPNGLPCEEDIHIDYEIRDLRTVKELL